MGSQPHAPLRTYPHGVTCWVDTEQPEVDAAIEFYGGLFGWTFEDAMPPGAPSRYVVAQLEGRDVAAIADRQTSRLRGTPTWLLTTRTRRSSDWPRWAPPFDQPRLTRAKVGEPPR